MAEPVPPEEGARSHEELVYRLEQQRLTAEFGLFALKCSDLDALLQEASRVCAQGLQVRFCKVMEYLPQERQFLVRAGVGWRDGVVGVARVGADRESPTGFAFQSGRPVISNHLAAESRFRTPQLLADHGIHRAMNVLIRGEHEPLGILEVDSSDEGRFSAADLGFLESMTSVLGVAVERQKAARALEASLRQQRLLTQEIGHRVKNSLAIVATVLRMQRRTAPDPDVTRALADAEARVLTVAQVHDHLWRNNEAQAVGLAPFVERLCTSFQHMAPAHAIRWDVLDQSVPAERALFIGLLINEVVTNAIKHAYPEEAGEIRLEIVRTSPNALRLEIADRGVGMANLPAAGRPASLGMRLLHNLGQQLEGEITWQRGEPGTRFILDFPG